MSMSLTLAAMFTVGEPMIVDVQRDLITDEERAVATLRAGDHRLEVGCTPYEVRRVWVRLRSNRWFRAGNAFNHHVAFTHRFDDQRPRRIMWQTDERSALLVGRDRVDPFIRWLLVSDQLIVRAPGPEGRTYDLVFEIEGARRAITEALEACGDRLLTRL